MPWGQLWKQRIQRIDHAMIYVLIAGTYTPIAAIVLDGWLRWAALATVWGIAAVGTAQKTFWPQHRASLVLGPPPGRPGLAGGAAARRRSRSGCPRPAVLLLLLGGLFYMVGMVAYATKRPRLWPHVFSYHEVFHVFVVAGSATHYAMTFTYVASFGA